MVPMLANLDLHCCFALRLVIWYISLNTELVMGNGKYDKSMTVGCLVIVKNTWEMENWTSKLYG